MGWQGAQSKKDSQERQGVFKPARRLRLVLLLLSDPGLPSGSGLPEAIHQAILALKLGLKA